MNRACSRRGHCDLYYTQVLLQQIDSTLLNCGGLPQTEKRAAQATQPSQITQAPLTPHWLDTGAGDICKNAQNPAEPSGLTQPTAKQSAPEPQPNTQGSSTSQPTKPKQRKTQRKYHPKHPARPTGLKQMLGTSARTCKTHANPGGLTQQTATQPAPRPKPNTQSKPDATCHGIACVSGSR